MIILMPGRIFPLVTDEIYHVYNRGVVRLPTFLTTRDYRRFLNTIHYYINASPKLSYSKFLQLTLEKRDSTIKMLINNQSNLIELIAYCLMPNHFHLLVKQKQENGISIYMSNILNSYTRYFNTKNIDRHGHVFEGRFKAKRIESDEQLVHVIRYIHLNPYTGYVIKTLDELEEYAYSSLGVYLQKRNDINLNKEFLDENFKSNEDLKKFTYDQADYQRKLDQIKHLTLED